MPSSQLRHHSRTLEPGDNDSERPPPSLPMGAAPTRPVLQKPLGQPMFQNDLLHWVTWALRIRTWSGAPYIDTSLRVHRLIACPKCFGSAGGCRLNCSKILQISQASCAIRARGSGKQRSSAVASGQTNGYLNWPFAETSSSSKSLLSIPQVSGSNPEGRTEWGGAHSDVSGRGRRHRAFDDNKVREKNS